MKFSLETTSDSNYIQSYDHEQIVIKSDNQTELVHLTSNLVLSPHQIITDQLAGTTKSQKLTDDDISIINSLKPELVIIVARDSDITLSPELLIAFSANAIGIECMALGPACRTYNLLVTEGRRVALVVNFL